MSGLFTRNVAVLNIDGEHLVYRRDRTLDGNNDGIIFQNGVPVQQQIQNGQPNNDAADANDDGANDGGANIEEENHDEQPAEPNANESIGGLNNDSSVIFVGEMSPNVSSDSVIYVGTTQAKREPNDVDNNGAVKEETNNNDDAELSQILNSFLTMNLNSPPIQNALDMPGSSTPNFADPLGYGHRFDRLYSMDYSFVPFGAAGFGNAIHGPFGYAPQPPANFGQYYTGFGAASFGPASFGAASFGAIRNNGNDLNDEPNSIYTTANEPSQLEETEQKYVLPSVKKENRD